MHGGSSFSMQENDDLASDFQTASEEDDDNDDAYMAEDQINAGEEDFRSFEADQGNAEADDEK